MILKKAVVIGFQQHYLVLNFSCCSVRCCVLKVSFVFCIADKEARHSLLLEAAVYKIVNRQKYLEASQDGAVEKDDVIVSLLADLQQEQDQESEKMVNEMQDKVTVFILKYWFPCDVITFSRNSSVWKRVVSKVPLDRLWDCLARHEGKQTPRQVLRLRYCVKC